MAGGSRAKCWPCQGRGKGGRSAERSPCCQGLGPPRRHPPPPAPGTRGLTRTRPSVIHHKGHGDWDGDSLAGRGAGEGHSGGQRPLAAGHRVQDADCVCDETGQPKGLLLLQSQNGWGPRFHLGDMSGLEGSTPTSASDAVLVRVPEAQGGDPVDLPIPPGPPGLSFTSPSPPGSPGPPGHQRP